MKTGKFGCGYCGYVTPYLAAAQRHADTENHPRIDVVLGGVGRLGRRVMREDDATMIRALTERLDYLSELVGAMLETQASIEARLAEIVVELGRVDERS